jgi:hypothetical protein
VEYEGIMDFRNVLELAALKRSVPYEIYSAKEAREWPKAARGKLLDCSS